MQSLPLESAGSSPTFVFAPLADPRAAEVVDAMRDWQGDLGPDPVSLVSKIGHYLAGLVHRPPREVLLAHLFPMADVIDAARANGRPTVPMTRYAVVQAVVALYDASEPAYR